MKPSAKAIAHAAHRPVAGVDPKAVLIRFAILLVLLLTAFRRELRIWAFSAAGFSEWSHGFVMPVVTFLFILCRLDDIRARLRRGSNWGLVLVLAGLAAWFGPVVFAQFGYGRFLALLVCLMGVVLVSTGGAVLRLCIPIILMLWLSLPLGERTVESKSLMLQRVSLHAAAEPLKLLPGVETRVEGLAIAYQTGDRRGLIGLAAQRFGLRLVPACGIIGVFLVFCRRRPSWQIGLLLLATVPILLLCNLFRIVIWSLATIYGPHDPLSTVPQNVSMVASLLLAYGCFACGCWALPKVGKRLETIFLTEDDEAEDGGD